MAVSDVDIVNNALLLLGDNTIVALSDATDRARLANGIYPTARDALLRVHPWNFARSRAVLNPHNLLVFGSSFDNAAWIKTQMAAITPNTIMGPDGRFTADAVIPSAATDASVSQISTEPGIAGTMYTFSVWLKVPAATKTVSIYTGSITDVLPSVTSVLITTTWQKFSVSYAPSDGSSPIVFVGGGTSWTAGEIDMWGATLTTKPPFGRCNWYDLPIDFLRAIAINDKQTWGCPSDFFEIEGRKLMTDDNKANLRYVAQIIDTTLFDPLFTNALKFRLAAEMAYPITGSMTKSQEMWTLYTAALKEANITSGGEGSSQNISVPDLIAVR